MRVKKEKCRGNTFQIASSRWPSPNLQLHLMRVFPNKTHKHLKRQLKRMRATPLRGSLARERQGTSWERPGNLSRGPNKYAKPSPDQPSNESETIRKTIEKWSKHRLNTCLNIDWNSIKKLKQNKQTSIKKRFKKSRDFGASAGAQQGISLLREG